MNVNCYIILYILALNGTYRMKNIEHCPYPTTTIPVRQKNVADKIFIFQLQSKSNLGNHLTRGTILTKNFETKKGKQIL